MSKLSEALKCLSRHIASADYNDLTEIYADNKVFKEAQAELLKLQRLQSTVKEFIEHEGIQCREDIYDACEQQNCPVDFIESLCNIVGYSE